MQTRNRILVAIPIILSLAIVPNLLIAWISADIELLLDFHIPYLLLVFYSRGALYLYLSCSLVALLARKRFESVCALIITLIIIINPCSFPRPDLGDEVFLRLIEAQLSDGVLLDQRNQMQPFFDAYRDASWSKAFDGFRTIEVSAPAIGSRKGEFRVLGTDERKAVLLTWSFYPWTAGLVVYESGQPFTDSPAIRLRGSSVPGISFVSMPGRM